jgi:hypothetical protein
MTMEKVGARLDELGLTVDVLDGETIAEAEVTVTTENESGGRARHLAVCVPPPALKPIPYPIEQRIITVIADDQTISEEQRSRVAAWLKANGIDPQFVSMSAITLTFQAMGDKVGRYRIHYTEYFRDENGYRFADAGSPEAVTVQRCVAQKVPLGEDPTVMLS